MNLTKLLMILVPSLLETMTLHFLYQILLTRNGVRKPFYIAGLAVYFAFQVFTYIYPFALFSTVVYYFIFALAISFLFFSNPFHIKCMVSALYVIGNYSCKLLAELMDPSLKQRDSLISPQNLFLSPYTQSLASVLLFGLGLLIFFLRRIGARNRQKYFYISLIPMGILFFAIRQFYARTDRYNFGFYLNTAMILLMTSLSLFYWIDNNMTIEETTNENKVMDQMLRLQSDYYKKREVSLKRIASLEHDMKKHLSCLYGLLKEEKYESARGYIREVYSSTFDQNTLMVSGNTMLDIILTPYLENAKRNGIRVTLNAVAPPVLAIKDIDLSILIGNLLDNAIEACERIGGAAPGAEKFLDLSIAVLRDHFVLKLENSFDGQIHLKKGNLKSVKFQGDFFGIGLTNVKKIVERYGGTIRIRYSGRVFTVDLVIPLDRG